MQKGTTIVVRSALPATVHTLNRTRSLRTSPSTHAMPKEGMGMTSQISMAARRRQQPISRSSDRPRHGSSRGRIASRSRRRAPRPAEAFPRRSLLKLPQQLAPRPPESVASDFRGLLGQWLPMLRLRALRHAHVLLSIVRACWSWPSSMRSLERWWRRRRRS